jgi:hypothetical protein
MKYSNPASVETRQVMRPTQSGLRRAARHLIPCIGTAIAVFLLGAGLNGCGGSGSSDNSSSSTVTAPTITTQPSSVSVASGSSASFSVVAS